MQPSHAQQFRVLAIGASMVLMGLSVARAQGSYASITGEGVEVSYPRAVKEADVRTVLDYLQTQRRMILADLGLGDTPAVKARVYESVGRFQSEAGLKQPWRGAYLQKGIIHVQPVQALVQRGIFETSLSYELAMTLLTGPAEKGCPRWLREAFAVHWSGETTSMSPPAGMRLASFADLDQDIQSFPNPPQRDDVHYVLGETMRFLVDRFGREKALSVYKAFDGTSSVETLFKRTFGEDFTVTERAWADHIQSVGKSVKKP